ncbi:MAG: DNA cytosine methyltransferase [Allosphingosinicella sp.]
MTLRVASLFSGIGGFEVGFQGLGFELALMCDVDPASRAILAEHFPKTRIACDVRRLQKLPVSDVLVGGWPCQDLSQAGRTAGIGGARSGLVNEVFRLIDAGPAKPPIVILENVAFALRLHQGQAIRYVVSELEARGYRWAYRVLDSRAFGLPQRRRRIFVCGTTDRDPWSVLFDGLPEAEKPPVDQLHVGFYWTEGNRGLGWSPGAVPPLKGGSSLSIPSPPAVWNRTDGTFSTPTIEDAEQFQGFRRGWTCAARDPSGSDRARWRLVGNAVSVNVAKWLGERLNSEQAPTEAALPWVDEYIPHNAARGGPGERSRYLARCHEGPRNTQTSSLEEFGYAGSVSLSHRAASGFLSRYIKSQLRKNMNFLTDLQDYCVRPNEETSGSPCNVQVI